MIKTLTCNKSEVHHRGCGIESECYNAVFGDQVINSVMLQYLQPVGTNYKVACCIMNAVSFAVWHFNSSG